MNTLRIVVLVMILTREAVATAVIGAIRNNFAFSVAKKGICRGPNSILLATSIAYLLSQAEYQPRHIKQSTHCRERS